MAFESYGGLLDTPKSEGGLDVLAQDTELLKGRIIAWHLQCVVPS